jgi:hypothetical protein
VRAAQAVTAAYSAVVARAAGVAMQERGQPEDQAVQAAAEVH